MSASFNDTLTTDLDKVRFALGDTTVSPAAAALYTDEAISAMLVSAGSVTAATAVLAQGLITRFAYDPVRWSEAGRSFDYTGRLEVWRALIASASAGQTPGISAITMVPAYYGVDTESAEY